MSMQISRLSRGLVLGIGIIAVLVAGMAMVAAAPLVNSDKRINQVADFGGDALYCMDAAQNPTNDSSTFDHFRLLSQTALNSGRWIAPPWNRPRLDFLRR